MRNDERLRTIYEVMAPYIVRNEHNWRDYLAFASQFHKHSFDNILLVYAQDEDVSILATRKQWATIGRNLIPRAKGVAVCVYRNAKLTLDYLFDVSQTTGKEIHPTDWQLSDEMKKALTERLSYAHGFPKQDFPQALYAMASESVAENYNHFLQELKQETKGHLFTEIPAGGFEAQYIQLLTDSISYFIGKKCHLSDEEIQLSDGMATVSHFNTLPLVAHLGTAVTALSKGILLEVERNIKIINRERMAQHEQTEYQSEIQGAGRDDASRSANLQQQRSRSTSGQVRPDGPGIPQRESPGAIYDFENGWQSDGDHAPGTGRGDREDRSPDAANAPAGAASADRGHHGADATPEQSETDGGGNRTPERSPDSPLTEEQPNTEVAPSAAPVGEPSEKDGSFSVPAEQPTRHFTDAEVRRNYEYILTSPNLYPPELHSAVRSVLSEPPLNPDWSDKGRQIAALFTPYGDREYQGDFLYRTRLHGEDGISFFFDEGYTYIPWNGLAFLLDAMIEDGDYPNPVVEEQPDPIGDYNIPDEVDEMGGPHRQMTIGEADFDYVLDAVAYEAGETVVEPVKPQAIVQMENDTPAAGDEPASVPDENPPVVVEAPETALPTDTAEQPTPPPVKENTTAHKNFRRFQELFPEIVSGQYEYLRLEAGEAYYPLVIHHKYGSHYCMEHYYMQNGDRMYDPYMDFQIDKEAGTLRAFSYENSGIGVYNEADPDDPAYEKAINGFNSFFATWLNNIRSQGYEPVRASMMVNDEEVDVDLRPAAEAVPVVEEEQPEQLSLLSLEKSTEDLLVERVMQRGPLTAGKKEQIYEFAQTHPTGSEFTTFLKKLYGYEGFSGDEMGVKYAMFNSEGVTIEWQDEQGETQETKLSWARAAGVVQRLVDEGRYLETPVVSLPEPETDEPLEGETEPYDYSFEYGLLGRLKADCEYFLSEGHQHEKHLWAGSVHAQIAKMRELYDLLPEKPEGITKEIIDDYETRMAPWEHDEAEETQILDEALDAHHGQIDMLMQAVRGELTVGTIRYSIFEGRPHISMIEVLEDYRRQGIATQMLRYLQGQYPNEEIVWGYLTEDGSALYQAVVDEQPNPDYLRVQNDLEDITREFDAYVRRLDGGAILSPQEAADMDDLEDTQYRLEKELEELRPIRAFVRMGDGRLLRIYNETFNTVRPREFDGSHLVFPGMNTEMKLRKHQLDFAARVIYTGTGLAAHEVGAGKTAALIAAGMYLKNLGAIHKAVFVVPNPLVGQWATEFYRFFPNANLLVSTAEDFTPKNRNRYISKIATGEYDAVILAHSQFEKIPISTERQIAMLERQINDIENAIHEIKSENGENWSVKQMVIFRKNLDERLKKLSAEEKKDDLLTFEQLGVDMMMVDEAHFFKNCFVFTKLRNVAGITTSSSQRAFDMLLKCQYLQETNQGRGVVFATGTPISNSISELFVMQRYLQPQELERFGWSYFDTWIAHFAKKASVLELKPEGGGYRMRDRFVRFYNLPELMAVFREVADIKTADMLDIPGLPAVRTGKAEIVSVEATPAQQAIMADFILRAEAIRTGRVKPEEDNMLKLTGEARLMAIDPRLIRPDADGTGSKLSVCIEDVYQVWKDTAASASTQLVFCDVGTPKAGKFNVYDEIRNVLLAKGVPESEIAFVHDATSEAQRQELFERTRQGKVRILIGSTSKLGTGVNVQNKVISIDHLDCPWKPSDITQRNGRGVRQGNENPEIMIKQFVAKGTFDAYLWQIQEQKLRYITQILTGKHIARSCEDVDETVLSAAQFKAAATDNPMVAQKMELENRVTELKILRGAWSNEQLALEHKVNLTYPSRIREYEQKIERVTQDISLLGQTEGKDFSIVLDGKHYTERPAAGEAFALLYRMISEGRGKDEYEFEIGSYRGFSLFVNFNPFERDIILRGALLYGTDIGNSGQGTITRIENLAERIPNYLEDARRELKETQKQLAVAQQQVGQPFLYEEELSEKVAQLTEINTKLEFESLQESEVILDENGQRSDGEEDWDSERVPACASAEV